jgi:hypothetical protein
MAAAKKDTLKLTTYYGYSVVRGEPSATLHDVVEGLASSIEETKLDALAFLSDDGGDYVDVYKVTLERVLTGTKPQIVWAKS